MNHWLFKCKLEEWSWGKQTACGDKGTPWNSVDNPQARKHMRAMKKGDLGFFYHTGNEKAVVGVVEVSAEARPRREYVDVRAVAPFPRPATLEAIRREPRLADMVLLRNTRLSVQPVAPEEWRIVCEMGGYAG